MQSSSPPSPPTPVPQPVPHAQPLTNGVREPSFFARLFAPKRTKVNCFYCNVDSLLHADGHETARKWRCRNCDNLNVTDENGEVVDIYLPEMYNESLNMVNENGRASVVPVSRPGRWSPRDSFCPECQANQTIVTQMLANYIPIEEDPEFEYYYHTVEDYRASIEDHYPLICKNCERNVDFELRRQSQWTRDRAFNSALIRSNPATVPRTPTRRPWKVALWAAGAAGWAGSHAFVIVIYLYAYLWPYRFHPSACASAPSPYDERDMAFGDAVEVEEMTAGLLWGQVKGCETFFKCLYPAVEYFGAGQCTCMLYRVFPWACGASAVLLAWDPTWLKTTSIVTRKVVGKRQYRTTQFILVILRTVSTFVLAIDLPIQFFAFVNLFLFVATLCGLIYSFNILTVKDPIQLRLKAGRVISFPNDDSNPSSPAPQSPSFHYDNDLVRRASSLPSSPTPRFATLNGPVFGASTSYADRSTFGTSSPAHHFATEDTSSPFARAQPTQTQTQTSNDYGMMDWAPTSVPAFLAAPQPRVPTQRVFGDLRNEAILSANANLGSGLLRSSSAGASTGGEMFASTANGFGLGAGSAGRSSGTRENHFRHRTNRGTDADVGALVNGFIGGTNNEERDWEMAPQRFFAPEKPTGLEDMFTASFKIQDESTFVRTLKMLNQQLHGQGRVAKRVILMAAMVRMTAIILIPLQAIYILFLGHALRLLVGYEQCLLHGNEAIDRSQKERNQAAVRGAPGLQDRQGVARRASKMENRKVATRHLTMTRTLISLLVIRLLMALVGFFLLTWEMFEPLLAALGHRDWPYVGAVLLDAAFRDGLALPFVGGEVEGRIGGFVVDVGVCVWGGWVWREKWQRPFQ